MYEMKVSCQTHCTSSHIYRNLTRADKLSKEDILLQKGPWLNKSLEEKTFLNLSSLAEPHLKMLYHFNFSEISMGIDRPLRVQ